jgi:hypothetical protein
VSDGIAGGQVVGIDLHLHRSVIARIDDHGQELGWVRIDNDPAALAAECREAGRGAKVAAARRMLEVVYYVLRTARPVA